MLCVTLSRPGMELVSPCPFPTTITITPWEPPNQNIYIFAPHIHFLINNCALNTHSLNFQNPYKQYIYIYIYTAIIRSLTSYHTNNRRSTRYVGDCRRSKDDLISDVFFWTSSYRYASASRISKNNIYISRVRTLDTAEDIYQK